MLRTTRRLLLLERLRRQSLSLWPTSVFVGDGWRNASAVAETTCPEENENIKLAPTAVSKLLELRRETPESALRVTVEGGGCSGFQYRFTLDEQHRQPDDLVFEEGEAKLLCDKLSFQFLKGSTVEFAESLMKSAFQIKDNPNSETSCGCGTSFSAKA